MNREGCESLEDFLQKSLKGLTVEEVKKEAESGVLIIDGRTHTEFIKEFIPGSLFLSLCMPFAQWIGTLIHPQQKTIVLSPPT